MSASRDEIATVVQIARGMGKHTIAEFVGDQEPSRSWSDLGPITVKAISWDAPNRSPITSPANSGS
jgi:hypothetical protein